MTKAPYWENVRIACGVVNGNHRMTKMSKSVTSPAAATALPHLRSLRDRDRGIVMMRTAEKLKEVSERMKVPVIYKSSFTKDNRSSVDFYQGPGLG
jgi:hypothetical protein